MWFQQAGERALAIICATVIVTAFVVMNPLMAHRPQVIGGFPNAQGTCFRSLPDVPGGPDPWGGCWPAEETTGLAGCPPLTEWPSDRISLQSNTTYENISLHGYVSANDNIDNVVIRCMKITTTNFFGLDTQRNVPTINDENDVIIDHVLVDCLGGGPVEAQVHSAYLIYGATITNSSATQCVDQFRLGVHGLVKDNWCGNQHATLGINFAHFDCAQTGGNSSFFEFRHNTMVGLDTADFGIGAQEQGDTHDIMIQNNLVTGVTGVPITIGANPTDFRVYDVTVRNNQVTPTWLFGPCTLYGPDVASTTWTNNINTGTGLPIPKSDCTL